MRCIVCNIPFQRKGIEKTCSPICSRKRKATTNLRWKKENRKSIIKYERKYNKTRKPRIRALQKKRKRELKTELFLLMGNKCQNPKCLVPGGCKDYRCLQIDHVKSDGSQERCRGTAYYYRNLIKFYKSRSKEAKRKYQLLCANCNWIKRTEKKEYAKPVYPALGMMRLVKRRTLRTVLVKNENGLTAHERPAGFFK